MNKEDIVRMAREAGLHIATDVNWMPIIGLEYAERFAKLVAQHEREAIAKMVEPWLLHEYVEKIRNRGQA
jgi:hypothetical protein